MFHEVLPDDTAALPPYAVTQSGLRAVLADFTRRGYRPGTLPDAVAGLDGGSLPRGRRLVLTFDDGTHDFLDYALPVLQEFDFTATLFIVAGLVGRIRTWHMPGNSESLPPVRLLNAGQLRDLAATGFTVGSHTLTHPVLPTLAADQAMREIAGSRATLQSMLGRPVEWFAYPYVA
jgi:peptidoglycan/xylan/chitin deacetylase (PgdA/CDA1 family)